ncbi:MAG: hypothetical protein QNK03_01750 [Myxococcota bacterium]|nr:hypothetical protein [Myxococcota bacterium]
MSVERTSWHPRPARRIAWVRLPGDATARELREGEKVGRFEVREIEPVAVLFSDGQIEFRRRVGAR